MRFDKALIFAAILFGAAEPANAGVFTDDLSRCLVNKTTESDKDTLMRWTFSALSLNPSLAKMSNLTPAQRLQFTKGAAGIYTRLLTRDCRKEAIAALKNEGEGSLGPAFNMLGQSAAAQIFNSDAVDEEMKKLGESFDMDALKDLTREAGISVKDDK